MDFDRSGVVGSDRRGLVVVFDNITYRNVHNRPLPGHRLYRLCRTRIRNNWLGYRSCVNNRVNFICRHPVFLLFMSISLPKHDDAGFEPVEIVRRGEKQCHLTI